MKKSALIVFISACLLVCLVPSVGFFFAPSNDAIGNEQSVTFPSLVLEDGSFNTSFFSDLGAYFENHFAFRSQIITADALIQGTVFGVSNLDSVVVGKNGWLYYSSTLDDYQGKNVLSQRQAEGIVHNLLLAQQRAQEEGADFCFAIAPNKNTLYPEYMPDYYRFDEDVVRNRDLLNAALAKSEVVYCNLFDVLQGQEEVLYHAKDSHWNNKGALLAYLKIMDVLAKEHDDYASIDPEARTDFTGDLNKMIYPSFLQSELEYYYGAEDTYEYTTPTKSVEDATIKTVNPDASGSLFMYRDSFGNALLPFIASAYGKAVFSKGIPIMLDMELAQDDPTAVIFEIAERNVKWFITTPPVMEAPRLEFTGYVGVTQNQANVTIKTLEEAPKYLEVQGTIDTNLLKSGDVICIYVAGASGKGSMYECFDWLSEEGEDGFVAYLLDGDYAEESQVTVSVMILNGGSYTNVGSKTVEIERSNEY